MLHIMDLLNDVRSGKVAGPFKLVPGMDHVIVRVTPEVHYKVPLVFASRHCTGKAKRLQTKGRRVTDLTGNGINDLQDPKLKPVNNLPSMNFLFALFSDKN